LLAIATTYSTPVRHPKTSAVRGWQAAVETNADARLGKRTANQGHQAAQYPTAPAAAVTLPGRNTAAHRYCSARC